LLGGCGSNLPESSAPPPAQAALTPPPPTVVTAPPGSTVITEPAAPGTATQGPGAVVIIHGAGTSTPPRLDARDIDALVRGNTASGTTSAGAPYYMHFERGGTILYREGANFSATGTWRTEPDGYLCTRFGNINAGAEDCYTLYRNAEGTYTYSSVSGRPIGSFTISPG
jgi:hypothetical protein